MGLTGGGRSNLNDGMREAGSGEVVFNLPSLGTNKIANCKKKYIKCIGVTEIIPTCWFDKAGIHIPVMI